MFMAPAFAQENSQPPLHETLPPVEVTEQALAEPGTSTTVSGDELDRTNNMKDVVRNQPLVSAPARRWARPGTAGFDRSGTTGYNIRGIEGNWVGMDVDGIEMPDATTRPYVSRAGVNSFGVGRDFIDPEMFTSVNILSGTTSASRLVGGIGGAVSFKTKSADDYLRGDKVSYFGGKLGYDSADRSWNESVTAAGKSGNLDGLLSYSRRDGHATRNNSDIVDSMANDWNSDALLLKGGLRIDAANRLELSLDLYRRKNDTDFFGWDTTSTFITENSQQHSDTSRNTLQLMHQWTPDNALVDQADTRLYFQSTDTEDTTDTKTVATNASVRNVSENKMVHLGLVECAGQAAGPALSQLWIERVDAGCGAAMERGRLYEAATGHHDRSRGTVCAGSHRLRPWRPSPGADPGTARRLRRIKTRDLDNFVSGVLTPADVEKMYGTPSTTIWSPSLGLSYDLTPTMAAYAQYKRSGRAPSAGEIFGSWNLASNYVANNQYALIGNQNLKEETSDAFEIGLKGKPTPGVTLNTSLFYTQYKDFIAYTRYGRAMFLAMFTKVPAHIGTIYQAENRDDAKIYGFELSARLDHGQWSPQAKGIYTTWAMGLSRGTAKSNYAGDKDVPLESVLPRKAIIGAGYDAPMKAWGVNLTGTFVGSKQAVATSRDAYNNSGPALADATTTLFRVPGHASFDLISYWQINRNVRLDAGIYNLGDKRYWDYSSARSLQPSVARDRRDIELLTEPGRTAAVSLNLAF